MKMVYTNKLVCLILTCVAIALMTTTVKATVDCNKMLSSLEPCMKFVQGAGSKPPPACCKGVKTIFSNAKTTPDRQGACQCLKDTAKGLPAGTFRPERVASLPTSCRFKAPFKLSTSINCKSVK